MNKSAIYATVKTSNLLVGLGAGAAVVEINRAYGLGMASALFLPLLALSIAWTYVGDWILKKLNVPNY